MSNNYREAMKAMMNLNESSYKGIVLELASDHPSIFVKIVEKLAPAPVVAGEPTDENYLLIKKIYLSNTGGSNKVAAIKKHRELYSTSLKEAKEAVEDLMVRYNWVFLKNLGIS